MAASPPGSRCFIGSFFRVAREGSWRAGKSSRRQARRYPLTLSPSEKVWPTVWRLTDASYWPNSLTLSDFCIARLAPTTPRCLPSPAPSTLNGPHIAQVAGSVKTGEGAGYTREALNNSSGKDAPRIGMQCKARSAAIAGAIASICNAAGQPRRGCRRRGELFRDSLGDQGPISGSGKR